MRVRRTRTDVGGNTYELLDDEDRSIPLVSGFLRHLTTRGCSPNTVSAYAHDLLHFSHFLAERGSTYHGFEPPDSLALLEYLREVPSRKRAQRLTPVLMTTNRGESTTRLSPATVNRALAAVSSFYEYLIISGQLDGSENPIQKTGDSGTARVSERHRPFLGRASRQRPIRRVVRVGTAQRLPRPLDDEQVEKLLGSLKRWRDRAMFLLMLQGGLRPGEVLNLHLEDVQYGRQRVIIRYRIDPPEGRAHEVAAGTNRRPARARDAGGGEQLRDARAASGHGLHPRLPRRRQRQAPPRAAELPGARQALRPPLRAPGHSRALGDATRAAAHARHEDVGGRDEGAHAPEAPWPRLP